MRDGGELGTLSVLFTDVVESTAQRCRLGDDVADRLQQVHDEVVAEAVAAHGGVLVKRLGDGALATFPSVADAIGAAVAIQQRLERHAAGAPDDEQLLVRIGISIGDVSIENGDVLGTPVVEAARLCGAATGGEILVAELARLLSRGRGGFAFEPVGEVELKGLPEPVSTCRVLWEPLPSPLAARQVPLPPPVAVPAPLSFVGRDAVLASLRSDWEAVRGGGHRTALLAGEPGIGKTRIAGEVARAAHDRGALVLFGRCDEELAMPYQPFVEALEFYVSEAGSGARLGRLAGELVRLVPRLGEVLDVGEPVSSDPRSEEFRLFEAVTSWLTDAAADGGAMLVVDDLHWATKPTLQMLTHVLRHAPERGAGGLFTVATYRDTDIGRAHPLMAMLADLRRLTGVNRHAIGGLTADEVVELAAAAAGHDLDAVTSSLAEVVHAETDGNPFFVGEVLRHLIESGAVRRVDGRWLALGDADVPEGVRDVVGRRVNRLSDTANAVLSAASVVGRDVDLDVLVAITGLDEDPVVDALDEAVRARLVEETGPERYRFAHALVRTTLYEELSATRTRRLHRRAADAVEKLHPDDVLGLARHLVAAGPDGGDVSRACRSVLVAGRQAMDRRSSADAETWFRQALELLEDAQPDEQLAVEALVGLGQAQRDQGDSGYRTTLLEASRRALVLDDVDLLVEAVLANGRGFVSIVGQVDDERVELIDAALDLLDRHGDRPSSRARLTALLSSELVFSGDMRRSRELGEQAVALARQLGDTTTLANVMVETCLGAWDPADPAGIVSHCEEAAQLADETGDPALRAVARFFAAGNQLVFGRVERARAITEETLAIADQASPNLRWAAASHHLKLIVGVAPIAEAHAANNACLALAEPLGEPDRFNWWAAVASEITFIEAGGIGSMADLAVQYAAEFGGTSTWGITAAWALADAGRTDESRALLAGLDVESGAAFEDPFPYQAPALAAQLAWTLGEPDLARAVEDLLTPHRECWAHYYLGMFGPLAYPLGLCAATLGDHARAVDLFAEAVTDLDAAGFVALATRVRLDLGRSLALRGGAGDAAAAREMLEATTARADELGAVGTADRARAVLAELAAR